MLQTFADRSTVYNFSITLTGTPMPIRLFELVLAIVLDNMDASLLIEGYPSSSDDCRCHDPTRIPDQQRHIPSVKGDSRVLDCRQAVLVIQFRLGLALVDLVTATQTTQRAPSGIY